MSYKIKTILKGIEIISPIIAPNNPESKLGYEDQKIVKEINKTCSSMIRNKLIESYEVINVKKGR